MSLARMKYNGYIHPIPVLYSPAILPYNPREMNPTLIHRSNLRILSRLASSKIRHTHVEFYRLITHLGHSSMAQQWSIVVGTKNGQVWLWYPTANPRFLRLRYLKIVSGKNCLYHLCYVGSLLFWCWGMVPRHVGLYWCWNWVYRVVMSGTLFTQSFYLSGVLPVA